jgi:hypothetical protein
MKNARYALAALAVMGIIKISSIVFHTDNRLRKSMDTLNTGRSSSSGEKVRSLPSNVLHASQQHGHWVGSSWIPPSPSWRLYDPVEILRAYSGKSILFVGDSTSRRSAQTLFSLMEEAENGLKSSPLTLSRYQQDSTTTPTTGVTQHVSYKTLDDKYRLEYNKYETTEVCPFMEELGIFQHNGTIMSITEHSVINKTHLAQQFPYAYGFCHRTPAFPSQPAKEIQRKRSDNSLEHNQATPVFGSVLRHCPCEVERWIRNIFDQEYNILSRFDVIVIGTGVWEAVMPEICKNLSNAFYPDDPVLANRDHIQIVEATVLVVAEYVKRQWARQKQRTGSGLSDSSTRYPKIPMIVWRTAGYDGRGWHELIDNINRRVIDLYETLAKESNTGDFLMTDYFRLIDWGGAVRPRSFHR